VRDEFARDALAAAVLSSEPFVRPDRGPLLGEPDPKADAAPLSIREVVEEHPQGMFLTGEPGNGKGAALRWLADSAAAQALDGGGYRRAGVKVPVYVALDRLPNESLDSASGVMEAIVETFVRTCGLADDALDNGGVDRDVLEHVAREYGLVVLLDGLNRIVARSKALVSVEEAMRELQKMPSVKVIVCSRAHVGNATALPEFRLCGLESREESIGFLERLASGRGEQVGEGAARYERMMRLRMTKGQLSNPFMLWLADQTLERLSSPVTRSSLYSAYHDLVWERARGAVEGVSASAGAPTSDARRILAAHCYHTLASRHDWAHDALGLGEWTEWMDRHGGAADAERVLDALAERTELVTCTGIPENPYTLFHPTFVEFYAAEYLAWHSGKGRIAEKISEYLGHPSFDNMLVFLAAAVRPEERETLFEALLSWDTRLAAQAVAEWHDPALAARLPRDGGLLLRAGAWSAALEWLAENPDAESAGEVASELAHHRESRSGALAWFEAHPDTGPAREVAREFVRHEQTRTTALAWLWRHPDEAWAWSAVLDIIEDPAGREDMLRWFRSHPRDKWAGRVGAGLARFGETRAAVLAWLIANPGERRAGRVARELVRHDDTRGTVVEWLQTHPDAEGAGRVACELAGVEGTRWAARRWIERAPHADWAGRVASELAGHEDSRRTALAWLEAVPDAEWAGLVAWKLARDDHMRKALAVWLRISLAEESAGSVAAELADHDDTRALARKWLHNLPGAQEAGRVARQLAAYPETLGAAREWMEAHPHAEWASFVARKLASYSDGRPAVVEWLESNTAVIGTGTVASELADHMDSRGAVREVLDEHAREPWAATVLAQQYDVRVADEG
jgi:hypothetical protein